MYDKLVVLSERMRCEKALLGGQVMPESLQQALEEGRAEFVERGGGIIAFGALWTRESVVELGSLWVAQEHRGQKHSSAVFARLVTRAPVSLRLFLITHEPHVVHLALKHGLYETARESWVAAIPWSASCGPCDRLVEADKMHCPFRAVSDECRLFVR